jgi:hypothetical protein
MDGLYHGPGCYASPVGREMKAVEGNIQMEKRTEGEGIEPEIRKALAFFMRLLSEPIPYSCSSPTCISYSPPITPKLYPICAHFTMNH